MKLTCNRDAYARLVPIIPPISMALRARSYLFLDNPEQALVLTRTAAEHAPKSVPVLIFHAMALAGAGRTDEAKAVSDRIVAINPRFPVARHLGMVSFRRSRDLVRFGEMMRAAGLPG
jgi:tetratricopeptide (TPR) repeat protein